MRWSARPIQAHLDPSLITCLGTSPRHAMHCTWWRPNVGTYLPEVQYRTVLLLLVGMYCRWDAGALFRHGLPGLRTRGSSTYVVGVGYRNLGDSVLEVPPASSSHPSSQLVPSGFLLSCALASRRLLGCRRVPLTARLVSCLPVETPPGPTHVSSLHLLGAGLQALSEERKRGGFFLSPSRGSLHLTSQRG